ncbi:MAG: AN1-type zinc finger domain-containing protein [Promethearchaeota archaeon]
MTNCYFCRTKLDDIPYRCKFCGMVFCSNHRLPENHECPFDLKGKSMNIDLLQESQMLYQDALDFIEKDLSVAKIYEFVTTKQMNEMEATEVLAHFLEMSEEIEIRIYSIMAFKVLELKNENVFNILEGCILSEENPEVKKTALTVIKDLFPKKSKDIRNWVKGN